MPAPATGLAAARELRAAGLDVLVLEARDRVGGRTLTKTIASTEAGEPPLWVDLGGSYVGPTQDCVLNLIEELKLETYLVEDALDIGYLRVVSDKTCGLARAERRARFEPWRDPPLGNWFHSLDYINMVRQIDKMGAQIPAEAPWLAERAAEWDAKTWRQFVEETCWTRRVRDFFLHIYVTIDVCADANEVSLLWFLWYVSQCGGYGRSISTTNGGQERKLLGGTQQLSCRLQELVGRQRVLLNKPVVAINQALGPFAVVTCTDGSQFKADQVICATPPHLWLKIHHEPALPAEKNIIAQRSPMGTVAKVILYYERPFWKEHRFSGCFLFDASQRRAHPVILSLDETKPDGSHPAIIGFVGARGWWELRQLVAASGSAKPGETSAAETNARIGRIVARSYADATQLEEFMQFTRVERFDWTEEQYSGGCYTSLQAPNTLTKFGRNLRVPFGRIHYAGTETSIKWSGYMDGALRAGKRAARELLHLRGLLPADQVWQEEPHSRSVPPRPYQYPSSHGWAPAPGSALLMVGGGSVALVLAALTFGCGWRRFS